MGKEKYQKEIDRIFQKSPVVNFSSITRTIRKEKDIKQYMKHLVRNLLLKGKIYRLTSGWYTKHEDPSLAVFCFAPAYLGLQDALSAHDLWEQETISIIITARKVRQGIRKITGMNVLVRRIDKKYFFGTEYLQQGNLYFPYSDIEKTLIDMVYFKERLSKEAMESMREKVNRKKLRAYLKMYPGHIRKMVLRVLSSQQEKAP